MADGKTLSGKFSSICRVCLCEPYCLWVDKSPPPNTCGEGHDDEPWKCGFVYNRLVAIVVNADHGNPPREVPAQHQHLLDILGPKADEIMAHIRSGGSPPHHRPKPIRYGERNDVH